MLIYRVINNVNGKIYIGQTKRSEDELDKSSYYGSGKLIKQAIIKYGIENFTRRVIWNCQLKTQKEINVMEKLFISQYDTLTPKGYNITKGGMGSGTKGMKLPPLTEEHKKKISETHKGRKRSSETRKKMSEKLKVRMSSKEIRQKMSLAKKGKTKKELGHKPNCPCCVCKAKRGELKGENNPNYRGKRVRK